MKTVVSAAKTLTTPLTNTTPNTVTTTTTNVTIIPKLEPEIVSKANLQFQTPSTPVSVATTNATKRPVSLDLNKITKKPRLVAPSPLQMDNPVNTPDVENIILSNNLIQTPKPGVVFPNELGTVTTEQEEFGKGFEEALISIHKNAQKAPSTNIVSSSTDTVATIATTGTGMSGGSFTYTKLETFPINIKDEPQNPPASPVVQPIDMENQEAIKLERKRQRNRVAASKCRKRKLERISKLEEKVKHLKGENCDLASTLKSLKDVVAQLKEEVLEHIDTGCQIPFINANNLLTAK